MSTVGLDITGENKDLIRAIAGAEKRAERLEERLKKMGETSKASSKKGQDGIGALGREMQGLVSGVLGPLGLSGAVMKIVSEVSNAYKTMIAEHRKYLDNIERASGAKARFLYNAASLPGGKAAAENMAREVAAESGAGITDVYDILATAISAGGNSTPEAIKSAAIQAAKLQRQGVGEGGDLVGSALDLSQITGLTDAEANFAFLRQIGGTSRAVTLKAQSNLVKGMLGGKQAGDSAEQAAEYAAAINLAMKDAQGEQTATGQINLANRLKSEAIIRQADGTWTTAAGGNTGERLASVQAAFAGADEATRAEMLKRIGGEAKMKPVIEMMFGNTAEWQGIMGGVQAKIAAPGSAAAKESMETFQRDMKTGAEAVTDAAQRGKAALENATLEQTPQAADRAAKDMAIEWTRQQGAKGALAAAGIEKAETAYPFLKALLAASPLGVPLNALPAEMPTGIAVGTASAITPDAAKQTDSGKQFFAALDDLTKQVKDAAGAMKDAAGTAKGTSTRQELD